MSNKYSEGNYFNSKQKTNRIVKGSGYFASRYLIGFISNFAGMIVITRSLGPSIWGYYYISFVLINIFAFLSLGGWGWIIQERGDLSTHQRGTSALVQQLIIFSWVLISLFVIEPLLAWRYGSPDLRFLIYAAVVGGYCYSWRYLIVAYGERRLLYAAAGVVEIVDVAVFNICAIIGITLHYGLLGLVVGNVLRGIISMIVAWVLVRPRLALNWDRKVAREVIRYSVPFISSNLLQWLPINAGPLVAGTFVGSVTMGYLSLAYRLIEYPRVIVTLIFRMSISVLAQHKGDSQGFNRAVEHTLQLLYLLLTPSIFILAALSPWWVRIVYGKQWALVSVVMILVATPYLITAGYNILATALNAWGAVKPAMRYQLIYNLVYWSALLGFVKEWGWLGLPMSEWVIIFMGIIIWRDYKRICGKLNNPKIVLPVLIAPAIMCSAWLMCAYGHLLVAISVTAIFVTAWLIVLDAKGHARQILYAYTSRAG